MNDMTFNEHATAFEAELIASKQSLFEAELNASNQSFAADFREASALKGDPGENGGYYEPTVTQIDEDTVEVSFTASKNGMAFVESQTITLPAGKDGQDGRDGQDGQDGYTPIKGVDYFDGRDGTNGKDGEPGAKGDKGEKGEKGDPGEKGEQGPQGDPGEKGEPGEPGADGKTPVKGTDYFTAADKQEMVTAVLAALPKYNGEVMTV
jgi:hypothetical protein